MNDHGHDRRDGWFDEIFARIQAAGIKYYADPFGNMPGEINNIMGGRGVYFDDPDGHLMEVLTWVIPTPTTGGSRRTDPGGRAAGTRRA